MRLLHARLCRLALRGLLPARTAGSPGRSTTSSAAISAAAPATGRSATRPWRAVAAGRRAGVAPIRSRSACWRRRSRPAPSLHGGPTSSSAPDLAGGAFRLSGAHPAARLVAGATEIGVELNKKFRRFPVLDFRRGGSGTDRASSRDPGDMAYRRGGYLTAVEEALGGEYPSLAKMLSVFAARQIRNRATSGGNLATASPDRRQRPGPAHPGCGGRPRLARAGAHGAARGILHRLPQTAAAARAKSSGRSCCPRPRAGTRAHPPRRFFSRSPTGASSTSASWRRAFCVDLDAAGSCGAPGWRTAASRRRPRGRAGPRRRCEGDASRTAAAAVAGSWRGIQADRRRARQARPTAGLVVSLWEKFAAGETSLAMDAKPGFSPRRAVGGRTTRARQLRHESAVGHVTGARVCRRRRPAPAHARGLAGVLAARPGEDPKARRQPGPGCPGIAAVLLAEDIPGAEQRRESPVMTRPCSRPARPATTAISSPWWSANRSRPAGPPPRWWRSSTSLCRRSSRSRRPSRKQLPHGSPMSSGAGTARLRSTAPRAARRRILLRRPGAFLPRDACGVGRGRATDGDVLISSSTQHPSEIQAMVAEVLGMPRNRWSCTPRAWAEASEARRRRATPRRRWSPWRPCRTGRPVRVQFDRDIDMRLTGQTASRSSTDSRSGYGRDGRLLAARRRAGLGRRLVARSFPARARPGPVPPRQRLLHSAVRFSGRVAKTNVDLAHGLSRLRRPAGHARHRGDHRPGRPEARPAAGGRARANLYRGTGETNTTHYGEEIGDNRLENVEDRRSSSRGFGERRAAVAAWNGSHPGVKRGLAITPVKFGISFTTAHFNQAGALVLIYQDGTVQVNHGGTEMGQGLHTKILGVAMRELGLPADRIRADADGHGQGPEHFGDSRLLGLGLERGGGARGVPDAAGDAWLRSRPGCSRARSERNRGAAGGRISRTGPRFVAAIRGRASHLRRSAGRRTSSG